VSGDINIPVLGIVGGIGSGKSYIASLFAKHGARVIDADKFGHDALKQTDIKEQVRRHWGDTVFSQEGEVDRRKLGRIVFADPAEKAKLEALVFPFIRQSIKLVIDQYNRDPNVKLLILDAAILLETGWKDYCTALVFVDASLPTRLQRSAKRGWDAAELARREASQWSLEKKKGLCQHIIPNEGDEVLTDTLVNDLVIQYSRQ
jgi:dephospho-CoA kinase